MTSLKEMDHTYIASTYGRYDLEITSGKGSICFDENGKRYIDLASGIAVNSFGYCDEVWKEAVKKQLDTFQHTSNLYYTKPCVELAKALCERTDMKKVFFCNSGAEANECAIKAARKYAMKTKGKEYYTIITLKDSFHGRTLTTLSATGQDMFHELFQPLTPGFVYADAHDIKDVERLVKENQCAAIMVEMIQGEGGVNALDREFVKGIEKIAKENDLLIIDDEVQCGNGRSGALYAYMKYDVVPDIMTTAKGIGGGLPIGVTMLGEKVKDIFEPGDNGSTFGANPVVCAGALTILNRMDEAFLQEVEEKSAYIFDTLTNTKGVRCVTGMGLMIGIEPENKDANDVVKGCMEKGVLVITAHGNKVRLLPALNIPFDVLKEAVEILKGELEK